MVRKILGLPLRVVQRAMTLLDGERSAPYPGPPMDLPPENTSPEPAAAPTPAAPPKPVEKAEKIADAPSSDVTVNAEATPNPNAMKFTLNQTVCETGSFSFAAGETPVEHAIAAAVLGIEGVETVFGVNDFITVTKLASQSWDELMPAVVAAIKSVG